MIALIHPSYFPSILHAAVMVQYDEVHLEMKDNYQKQTFRNRMRIAGPNGRQSLAVPVKFTQKKRQLSTEVAIDNSQRWQDIHFKSLNTAYSNSPFYEFYQDRISTLFSTRFDFIIDLDLATIRVLMECIGVDKSLNQTTSYRKETTGMADFRFLIDPRKQPKKALPNYIQVFSDKYSFLSNLSFLDLLFNQGPSSLNYLESLDLTDFL